MIGNSRLIAQSSRCVALAASLVLFLPGPVQAQGDNLSGSWRGRAKGITFNLVIGADRQYSLQVIAGSLMTTQQGYYRVTGPGVISFVVQDWQPRTLPVYHPSTTGIYITQKPTLKPPGGNFRVRFNSPDSVTLIDVSLGGSITYHRRR